MCCLYFTLYLIMHINVLLFVQQSNASFEPQPRTVLKGVS